MLSANVIGISASQQSCSTGGTFWLDIVLLQYDSSRGQLGEMGGNDGGVVPGDIVEAKVICQNKHNIGLFGDFAGSPVGSVSVA